ncbi:MAG TPA: quinate 5-dehydrogenase, partial [Armatimonadetes bacterium]|nr:quinate 5-dehydrogenase [Armatimonadota bacterium]
MATDRPLHVVSVSIGSSTRDKSVEVTLGGRGFILERRGTDGDLAAARALIAELDGQVDVFGLGGIDLYLFAAGRRYTIRDAARLAAAARRTPVVDGSGLKAALEPAAVDWLEAQQLIDLRGAKALVVTAVDRFGLAETLAARAREICFGDLMFNVGLPVPIRSAQTLAWVARAV